MSISEDRDALESLPLRLLIVAVVAAMSVVPAAEALEAMEDREFVSRAGIAMDKLAITAQALSMQGPGASRTVEVDMSSAGSLKAVRLTVGDEPDGPCAGALVLDLSSGAKIIRLVQDPPVTMTSPAGLGLVVGSDRFSLRMLACIISGESVIMVEVV